MTLLSPPSVSRDGGPPPDDVDRILRAFFKAEMPDPWPSAEAPPPRRLLPFPAARPSKRWPLMRSRLALAASVALLVTGLLFLAGAFQGRPVSPVEPVIPMGTAEHPEFNGALKPPTPHDLKIDESLIQTPDGTTIRVRVDELPPMPPK
jgi:hypothetical protein